MTIYPDLPYDAAGGHGGSRVSTQMIVVHCTDNTASATAEAHYAENRPDHTSAHFYGDEKIVIQALDTGLIAYGCFPTGNSRSVQFELVGLSDHISDATMRRAAPIVARVCADYGIPVRHVGPAELVAGARGVCGHADVTAAWHQGDHTDPGASFPWSTFLGYVQAATQAAARPSQEVDVSNSIFQLPQGFAFDQDGNGLPDGRQYVLTLPVDNAAGQDISVACDLGAAVLRVATRRDGADWAVKLVKVDSTQGRVHIAGSDLIPGGGVLSVGRCRLSATDTDPHTPVGVVVNTHA